MVMDKNNKSFCAVPFVSTMINTDTTIRYCCMVKGTLNKLKKPDNKTFYTCKDDFIHDSWNSQDMRNIRKAMISGDKIEGCNVCYMQEENGRTSNRQHSINEWKWRLGETELNSRIQQAIDNDGIVYDEPVYLDLRLGNLCNLKCRMCNPWNSSQIFKEHSQIIENDKEYAEVWRKTFGKFPVNIMDDQPWFDHDIMWDQVISLIPKLKKVYMTGGEPTLIKNNFKFMQSCIDQGRKDILLFFNTNCTNINKNFLELIKQFDNVSINASMDGVGFVNEYIRAPSDWSQISSNIEALAQLPNVHLGITPTVQVYNIFNLVEILRWVEELSVKYSREIFIDFLINVHPHHLNINILPDHMRQQVLDDLLKYKSRHMNSHPMMTGNSLEGVIGLLQQPRSSNYEAELEKFKQYTLSLDKHRNQNLADVDVRLVELINV
jgi:MoaA/NifB/PqqE/SkfB family radical SAM enzyme